MLDRYDADGYDSLTPPQRHVYNAWLLDVEVCNGGFHQYFVNSSGNTAGEATEAFVALVAHDRADIVRRAVAVFGPNGPPADCDVRHEQLARFSNRQDKTLNDIDSEYYSAKSSVAERILIYATENAEHFRPFETRS